MPPKRSPSPSNASPCKRTERSPPPNPSPSSPPSSHPVATDASASEQHIPVVVSPLRPISWQTVTSAEIDEALKSVFQLGGYSFDVNVTDLEWRRIAKRLRYCARCEGKGEPCSAASGTELVCNACQKAHKGCSLGITYQYCLFAKQQFDSWMAGLSSRSYNSYCQPPSFFTSLEEAIQHAACSAIPPPSSVGRVGPPGWGRIVKTSNSQTSPSRSHHPSPRKQGDSARTVASSSSNIPSPAIPVPSLLPSREVQVIRGPTILRDTLIPPGLDLTRELQAFEDTEAQITAASKARFFKEQADARLVAAEMKCRLEAEQQCKEKQRLVKKYLEQDMREKERGSLGVRQRPKRQVGSSSSQVAMPRPSAISPRPVSTPPVILPGSVPSTLSTPPPSASTPIPSPIPLPTPSLQSPTFSPLVGQSANPSNHWFLSLVGYGLLPASLSKPVWMGLPTTGLMSTLLPVATLQ
ncbi:hypothetical protein BT96DRAFT_1003993 [Gymnopus androsaceus JB14]|uniref:Uncharacterized protein n=1 Tax=Gymnopus androsaceus JB14 TaxID=1447944 RepID=A0A6A4GSC0_9AGAR|nr:hypothetical protein BT96DRAFT_1003993 [Gymnopus androsaceus JB14]